MMWHPQPVVNIAPAQHRPPESGKVHVNMRTVQTAEVKVKRNDRKQRKSQGIGMGVPENTGRWTKEEHNIFLEGLQLYGKEWKKLAGMIKTRTVVQIRTHAQKYFQKLQRAQDSEAHRPSMMPSMTVPKADGVGSDASNVKSGANQPVNRLPAGKRKHDATENPVDLRTESVKARRFLNVPSMSVTPTVPGLSDHGSQFIPMQPVIEPTIFVEPPPSFKFAPPICCPKQQLPSFSTPGDGSPTGVDAVAFRFPMTNLNFSPESAANLFQEDSLAVDLDNLFGGQSDLDWLKDDEAKLLGSSFGSLEATPSLNNMTLNEFLDEWDAHNGLSDDSAAASPADSPAPPESQNLDEESFMLSSFL